MTTQSSLPLPTKLVRWKEGQWVYYFNHKDNGVQPVDKDGMSQAGKRYTAEFIIVKNQDAPTISAELAKSILDPDLSQKIIDNIEVESKPAIDIIKSYKIDAATSTKVSSILTATPVKTGDIEVIRENI